MLANRRIAKTACLMHSPNSSMANNIGLMTNPSGNGNCMCGT